MSFSFVLLSFLLFANHDGAQGKLEINFSGINSRIGTIHLAIYDDPEKFPKQGQYTIKRILKAEEQGVVIDGVLHGKYAVAAFHDLNGNGKLDKNVLGIPNEPYAFSNNLKPKWKRPTFLEAMFEFNSKELQLNLTLAKWKDL